MSGPRDMKRRASRGVPRIGLLRSWGLGRGGGRCRAWERADNEEKAGSFICEPQSSLKLEKSRKDSGAPPTNNRLS